MKKLFSCFSFFLLVYLLPAQEKQELLNVFLGPENFDFFRSEVNFVNFVSDRRLCDVQWQSVVERIDNDAVRYRYLFIGYGQFEGQNDTIIWHSDPAENEGSIREKSLLAFKQGLLTYLLQTPMAQSITYQINSGYNHSSTPDPWNKWTFKPSLSLYGNNQAVKESNPFADTLETRNGAISMRPSFSSWYISDQWKLSAGLSYFYFHDWRYSTNGIDDFSRKQAYLTLRFSGVYSLTSHWSVGAGFSRGKSWNSELPNPIYDVPSDRLKLGVEYSFLPYRDYFRKRLVVGYSWMPYLGGSIKLPEFFMRTHQVFGEYAKIASWGYFVADASSSIDYEPDSWTNFSLKSSFRVAINLGKNIYTTLDINGAWSKNKRDLSILTNEAIKRQTGQYAYSVGIDYYFGSGYRNVVNPRFYTSDQVF